MQCLCWKVSCRVDPWSLEIIPRDVNALLLLHTEYTPLTYAIQENDPEQVRLLLAHPQINVNRTDAHGHTPLVTSMQVKHDDMQRQLIMNPTRAKLFSQIWNADSPQMSKFIAVLRMLLDRDDIRVNRRDKDGDTALVEVIHFADWDARLFMSNVQHTRQLLRHDLIDVHLSYSRL